MTSDHAVELTRELIDTRQRLGEIARQFGYPVESPIGDAQIELAEAIRRAENRIGQLAVTSK